MRVIAGTCRGKKLTAPPGVTTRPTSDRVKEALFSILSSRIDFADIRVLDICAGTGSLGIEALSRGAGSCCFIESNRSVTSILEKNLLATSFQSRSELVTMDVMRALHVIAGRGQRFDLAFFDPPYGSGLYQRVLETVGSADLLTPGSILVAECSVRNPLQESYGRLKRLERRVYGETALELLVLEEK
ncbi:MAG: 16S rRNA (guanine(966)-N(2))-methyltransferase RsmD [Desulfuromonadaceae bacterium]